MRVHGGEIFLDTMTAVSIEENTFEPRVRVRLQLDGFDDEKQLVMTSQGAMKLAIDLHATALFATFTAAARKAAQEHGFDADTLLDYIAQHVGEWYRQS